MFKNDCDESQACPIKAHIMLTMILQSIEISFPVCLLIDCFLPCLACTDITGCSSICDSSLAHVEKAGAFTCRFRQLKEGHNQKQTTMFFFGSATMSHQESFENDNKCWRCFMRCFKVVSCILLYCIPFLTSIWFKYVCYASDDFNDQYSKTNTCAFGCMLSSHIKTEEFELKTLLKLFRCFSWEIISHTALRKSIL